MARLDRQTKNYLQGLLSGDVVVGTVRFSTRLEWWDGQAWVPVTELTPTTSNNTFPATLPMTLS